MDSYPTKSEVIRLRKIKRILERQEAALMKMLEVIDKQLLVLEVEDLQLASNLREQLKEETCDDSFSDNESVNIKSDVEEYVEADMNKTQLNLDSRLDEMLSGQFYVEEDDVEEMEELM